MSVISNFRFWFLILLCQFACTLNLLAQTLTVNGPSSVGVNDDYFAIQYKLSAIGEASFIKPSMNDFILVSGPNVSISSYSSAINGKATHPETTTYTLLVKPKSVGSFTIGAASVRINGKTISSKPLKITVNKGSSTKGKEPQLSNKGNDDQSVMAAGTPITQKDLFLKVIPSRTSLYEQEAVRLTYKFYARLGVSIQSTMLTSKPDFQNMVSEQINVGAIETTLERINGENYKVGTLTEYVVIPQSAGKIKIPALTFDFTIIQRDSSIDELDAFFNGGGFVGKHVERSSNETNLDVKPLPLPQPADFTGGVGKIDMSVKLLNKEIKTNEIATLRVIIQGNGNLKLITPPQISFPKDFETFDVKTTDSTHIAKEGVAGKMAFDYTFVPHNVGEYSLDSIQMSYFDVATQKYITLHTDRIKLEVKQGSKSASDFKSQLSQYNKDIRPIITSLGSVPPSIVQPFWKMPYYWISILCIIILCLLIRGIIKLQGNSVASWLATFIYSPENKAQKRLNNILSDNKKPTGRETLDEIQLTIDSYFCNKFQFNDKKISSENIKVILSEAGYSEQLAQEAAKYYSQLEQCRYAPGSEININELATEACNLIKRVNQPKS